MSYPTISRTAVAMATLLSTFLIPAAGLCAEKAAPPAVGRLGYPENLVFEGNKAFTAKDILDGLQTDADFLMASHPAAPRDEYIRLAADKVRAGYQNCGFPDARVVARLSAAADRLTLGIEEGARYTCGTVKVTGAKEVPAEKLVRLLTESRVVPQYYLAMRGGESESAQTEQPAWKPDAPAPFGEMPRKALAASVGSAYAELGRLAPKYEVLVSPDKGGGKATLLITVQDEGPRAVLGKTRISGLVKNSEADLLKLLELKPGMGIDRGVIADINLRLWRSGRFLGWKLRPGDREKEGAAQTTLAIEVVEYDRAPALSEELTALDRAMLKLRDWMVGFADRGEDLVAEGFYQQGRRKMAGSLILSPHRGAVVSFSLSADDKALLDHRLVLLGNSLGAYSSVSRRKCVCDVETGSLMLKVRLIADPQPGEDGNPFMFNIGCALQPDAEPGERGVSMSMRLDPVVLLELGRRCGRNAKVEKGVLSIDYPDMGFSVKAEAESGRLLEMRARGGQNEFSLRFEKGACQKALDTIRKASAEHHNAFDPKSPAATMLCFLGEESLSAWQVLGGKDAPDERTGKVLRKLLVPKRFGAVDRLWAKLQQEDDEHFSVPVDLSDSQKLIRALQQRDPGRANDTSVQFILGSLLLWASERCLPRESWAWTVGREAGFALTARSRYLDAEMNRLSRSPDLGPLACLVCTTLSPASANAFARKGLERMTAAALLADCQPLLARDLPLGASLRALLDAVRDLGDDEIDALAALLFAEHTTEAKQVLQVLCASKGKPLDEALSAMAEETWKAGLKAWLEKALRARVQSGPGLFERDL